MSRVAFHTLGCRSNYADTIDLQAALAETGRTSCSFDEDAEVFVLNTCTVTDEADKEALRILRRVRRGNPRAKIVVTGCMAEVGSEKIEALDVDAEIIGPGRRGELLAAITGEEVAADVSASLPKVYPNGQRAKRSAPEWRSISLEGEFSGAHVGPGEFLGTNRMRSRYHLRVQEGCENSCTFCIIPRSRGRLSSRPLEDVLSDCEALANLGYQEIVLTGTHLGGYGVDIGSSLYELLLRLEAEQPALRFRLSSIDPNDLSKDIIDLFSESGIFCPHLHICIQAFSSRTLKRMNRKYSLEEAEELIDYVVEKIPGVCLGTDVIVGFPGETRAESDEAMEYIQASPFSYLHVFPYSEREGTAATRLDGIVPLRERKRRASRMRAVSRAQRADFMRSLVGAQVEVLFEQASGEMMQGTTREFMPALAEVDERPGTRRLLTVCAYSEEQEQLICES